MQIFIGVDHSQIEVKKIDQKAVQLTTLKVTGDTKKIGNNDYVDVLETQEIVFMNVADIERYIELLGRAKEMLQDEYWMQTTAYALQIKGIQP